MREILTFTQLHDLLQSLVGLPVSLPMRTYGSALSLDLGRLELVPGGRPGQFVAEAAIFVEWDWRLETYTGIVCGSSNSGLEMEAGIAALFGARVIALTVEGVVPELTVSFSNGQWFRSMAMVSGDPRWRVKLPDQTWLSCEAAQIVRKSGAQPAKKLTAEEREAIAVAEETASRWGRPKAEPAGGECRHCRFFVHLHGDFALLDYGACIQAGSPLDGRVVNVTSGCPLFVQASE